MAAKEETEITMIDADAPAQELPNQDAKPSFSWSWNTWSNSWIVWDLPFRGHIDTDEKHAESIGTHAD